MTLALVTNDDGVDSPGLHALARLAADLGLDVLVAAPTRESSGASASLGAVEQDGRIVVEPRRIAALDDLRVLAVRAAPAFIVRAALHEAFGTAPDLVLSGVNQGANTGHALLHSGTAGAAVTATTYGRSSLAVSLASTGDQCRWSTATAVARPVVEWLLDAAAPVVLNLNVPNVAPDAVRGLRRARLASFGAVQAKVTEVGHGYVHLEYSEIDPLREPESDAGLLAHGWAVLTPSGRCARTTGSTSPVWHCTRDPRAALLRLTSLGMVVVARRSVGSRGHDHDRARRVLRALLAHGTEQEACEAAAAA